MKEKKSVNVASPTVTKVNGRTCMKAVCPRCGCKLFKFGGK